jgi:adenosylmethionine-8-amino-7-oxononanoate aminotransferase
LNHVFYSSDGACAVEAALKIAFQYWQQCREPRPQKQKYGAFSSAYHGDTLGSTAVGGIERFHALYKPLLFDVIRLPPPERRRGDAAFHLNELEAVLSQRHEEVAALVIEPIVQGAAGMILQPEGYLRGVRELTQKYDVLLIADEIVSRVLRKRAEPFLRRVPPPSAPADFRRTRCSTPKTKRCGASSACFASAPNPGRACSPTRVPCSLAR